MHFMGVGGVSACCHHAASLPVAQLRQFVHGLLLLGAILPPLALAAVVLAIYMQQGSEDQDHTC